MENLKNTINKTETLLNNVKLAKDKINKTVVRGGGITSKSLSEIPNNIKSMISKNYKKIAIIKDDDIISLNGRRKEVKIPLRLDLEPNLIFLTIESLKDGSLPTVNSKYHISEETCSIGYFGYDMIKVWVETFSKDEMDIVISCTDREQTFKILEIIAIE